MPPTAQPQRVSTARPLCADLDRGLLRSSLMAESVTALLRTQPWMMLAVIGWRLRGRGYLWQRLAERTSLQIDLLPFHEEALKDLREARAQREVVMVTTAPEAVVRQIADSLQCWDRIAAPGAEVDSMERFAPSAKPRSGIVSLWRALRPHQWAKNILVLMALGTSHRYRDWNAFSHALLAAGLFCLASSSVYLWNDLIDLDADRRHPLKRKRPLAAGELSPLLSIAIATVFAATALWGSYRLAPSLAVVLAIYMATSSLYSVWIKQLLIADIVVLACLYVLRAIAGGLAIGVWLSFWTLAFSLFFFFSLALLKRYSELRNREAREDTHTHRRAYVASDALQINTLGVASSLVSVLIVGFYIDGAEVKLLYRHPEVLWILCPLMLSWCAYIWILAGRGEIHEDPVAFALHDRTSYLIGTLMALTVIAAR